MTKLIGTDPNQVPTNADLGTMAYQDYGALKALLLAGGNRNMIINGAMQVAQRGTSFGNTSNNNYTLDRWKSRRYGANNYYVTQGNGLGGDPFVNYVKVRRNTGDTATGALSLTQRIEPINFKAYRGRTVTLSFLYKTGTTFSPEYLRAGLIGSNSASAVLSYWAYDSGAIGINDKKIEPSTAWKQHTITYNIPSNAEQLAVAFGVEGPYNWSGTAGSDDSFQIANVQLELGKVATPFEHRSYGEELAACQRYYQKEFSIYNEDGSNGFVAMLPVEMRVSPTATRTGSAISGGENVPSQVTPTARRLYIYNAALPTGGFFNLDAEL